MSHSRVAARSAVLLLAARITTKAAYAAVGIWITRYLGVADAGIFYTAFAFASSFLFLFDFGISPYIVRESSRSPSEVGTYFGLGITLYVAYSATVYALMTSSARLIGYDPEVIGLILVLGLMTVLRAGEQVANAVLQVTARLSFSGIVQFLGACAALVWVYYATIQGAGLSGIALILTITVALSFVSILLKSCRVARPKLNLARTFSAARESSWFGLTTALGNAQTWLGVIILSIIGSADDVGYYSASFRLVNVFTLVPFVLFVQVLAPALFAWAKIDKQKVDMFLKRSLKYMLALGAGTAVLILVFSEAIIILLFGPEFRPSAVVFRLEAFTVIFVFVASCPSAILTSMDRLPLKIVLQVINLVSSAILYVVMISWLGYIGCAIASAVSYLSLFALYYFSATRLCDGKGMARATKLAQTTIAAVGTFCVLYAMNMVIYWWISALVGTVVYLGLLSVLKFVDSEDRALFQNILRPTGRH